jgi:hypothetical protein
MSLFLTVRLNETLYVELPEIDGCNGGARLIRIMLREKRGRTARLQVDAPRDVYVDVQPRNGVKGEPNTPTRSHE